MRLREQRNNIIILIVALSLSHCSLFNRDRQVSGQKYGAMSGRLIGDSLGEKALGENPELLAELHDETTEVAPAALRADPDVYVRQLLREYRPEGETMAREIGRVEKYRLLLGGASDDFKTSPAKSFDATSLLASQKVAEEICISLVAPTSEQRGWTTILPHPPSDVKKNLVFLAQRFLGLPEEQIPATVLTELRELVDEDKSSSNYRVEDYVSACVALAMDADALLF
jgi:hypothetical protein